MMMKLMFVLVVVFACIASVYCWDSEDEVMNRVYRAVMLKTKRSPSMGLSLAEYMASPQGGDNFHFIPSGRK